MRQKRLLWQIYPSFLLITAVSLVAVSWYAYHSLGRFYSDHVQSDLRARALLSELLLRSEFAAGDHEPLDSLCKVIGEQIGSVITVILANGQVVGDSRDDPADLDNQSGRPEVAAALKGEVGSARRFTTRFGEDMDFLAVPLQINGEIAGVVRVAWPHDTVTSTLSDVYLRLGISALLVAALAVLLSLYIVRRISRPFEEIKIGADRIARGDLDTRVPTPAYEEMDGLTAAMNKMAEQLDDRFKTVQRQRLEQQAIVSSMVEGVLAIDVDQRVMSLNTAAARLLSVNPREVIGRNILEVIRNSDLQRLVSRTLTMEDTIEGDISISDDEQGSRFLQAHGTLLRDPDGTSLGALVVLNDVTRLRKLENVRRDFVANVSHELKTPITSIKGFVETLLEGEAMDEEERRRFLGIVSRQASRLHAIIEDLLRLSRIEQESERGEIPLEIGHLREVLAAAITSAEQQARARNITINLSCDPALQARINAPLLEQAVFNLIENAVKYSDPDTQIAVGASLSDRQVTITVRDQGYGIAKEHFPRLFERFYRVDRARSRSQGGTGLGLAIVKHIVLAHGGNVTVQSEIGQGSTFTITLAKS